MVMELWNLIQDIHFNKMSTRLGCQIQRNSSGTLVYRELENTFPLIFYRKLRIHHTTCLLSFIH